MNADHSVPPRRVAIACSGGVLPGSLGALLRHLALAPGDELRGLFIEDSDLLKVVALPFVVEFCEVTSVRRPIDSTQVEHALRRAAAAAERALARCAADAGLSWQFQVVREKRHVALNTILASTDTVVITPALETVDRLRAARKQAPVVAIADAGPASTRALALARAIATADGAPLEIYHHEDVTPASLARMRRRDIGLVIVAGALLASADQPLRDFCETSAAPVVIVR